MSAHPAVFSSSRARLRRPQTWALVLTAWLVGRTARAQDADAYVSRGADDPFGFVMRHRHDDPDLLRAGIHPTPTAALAPGARVLRFAAVDLDARHEGLVMAVAPRDDPAPENEHPGAVLLVRDARGWRATVLFREEPSGLAHAPWISALGWDVVSLRGRRALVLRLTTGDACENASGRGRHTFTTEHATLLRWVDGQVHFSSCQRVEDAEEGVIPWHTPDAEGGAARGPAPGWCRARATVSWRADRGEDGGQDARSHP